jgi:predicted phage terminase large subunit-like protein
VTNPRWEYPELKTRAIEYAQRWKPSRIIIEDAGSGTALAQELRRSGYLIKLVRAERDKFTRMSVQSAKIAAGNLLLPRTASWLPDLENELLSWEKTERRVTFLPPWGYSDAHKFGERA